MRVSMEEAMAIVRLKYPYAKAVNIEPLGKRKWYQIISPNRVTWVGQGPSERLAWISAANMVVSGC